MLELRECQASLELLHGHEVLRLEAWGCDSVRVRVAERAVRENPAGALSHSPGGVLEIVSVDEESVHLRNGELHVHAHLDQGTGNARVLLRFSRGDQEVLAEAPEHFWWPGAHGVYPIAGGVEAHQVFSSSDDEKLFGLGQCGHGRLDHKGLVTDLVQRNGEVSIPFVLSSRGYGFLWNNPAVGRVEMAANRVRWVAQECDQIDYWVSVADRPSTILRRYADAVGHAPVLPDWATGLWQSKLRYQTQDELMNVARRYWDEGIYPSVFVSDYIHWPAMGDFCFDRDEFPEPKAMVDQLGSMGARLMVSVWPTVSPLSRNAEELRERGFLVRNRNGVEYHQEFKDKGMPVAMPVSIYDATNPDARTWLWQALKRGYYDYGIKVYWLDACEPELNPGHPGNLEYFSGPGSQVSNSYPRDHAKGVFDGMRGEGEDEIVLLSRSAWAGQAQYGTAVWSGDIAPTWEALRAQVTAGQSIGIAGIPWWTSDIGGFHGGDPRDPDYQELFIRWFQFGALCPLFRMHGHREPRETVGAVTSGGPNEIWSYGDRAFRIARHWIQVRESIRPYLHDVMVEAAHQGMPAMRALFLEFPDDSRSWCQPDEYLLGPDLLVAPVTSPHQDTRTVYLPMGCRWRDPATGATYDGGQDITVPAPLERTPILIREGGSRRLARLDLF